MTYSFSNTYSIVCIVNCKVVSSISSLVTNSKQTSVRRITKGYNTLFNSVAFKFELLLHGECIPNVDSSQHFLLFSYPSCVHFSGYNYSSCSDFSCSNELFAWRKCNACNVISVLLEESLLVLYGIISNTNSCCIISKISILETRHVVLIVAASITMHPVQIYLHCRRFFLVTSRLSRVTCGSFNLAFEWLDCHKLICFNL